MQWEGLSGWNMLLGMSGWNGLLGIWGLELEWTARDRGEAAPDMQQEQGARNGNRAPRVEMGILWADEGKAVRGAVSEMCEALERHDRAV